MRRRLLTAAVAAVAYAAAALSIIDGAHLDPDTAAYASGRSWWSSPLTALAGAVAGRAGVDALALAAAAALVALVAYRSDALSGAAALAVGAAALVTPVGRAIDYAGADALGALFAAALYLRPPRGGTDRAARAALASTAHLAAGLVLAAALAPGLRRHRLTGLAAGLGAMAALPLVGLLHGVPPDQAQWRYLLPGLALAVVRRGEQDDPMLSPERAKDARYGVPREATDAMTARRARYSTE